MDLILFKSGYEPSAEARKYCKFIEKPQDIARWIFVWDRWQATGGTLDGWIKKLFYSEKEDADAN